MQKCGKGGDRILDTTLRRWAWVLEGLLDEIMQLAPWKLKQRTWSYFDPRTLDSKSRAKFQSYKGRDR